MGEMTDLLNQLQPPGYEKKNRGAVYRIIARVVQRLIDDASLVLKSFFPFLCDASTLVRHALSLGIPRFPFDTDDEFRERTAAAGYYLEQQGERGLIREILDRLVPERYKLVEYPNMGFRLGYSRLGYSPLGGGFRLYVKVLDLTGQEAEWIYIFLDNMLDPDITISVIEWIQ